jgi:PAP2 superfamily C-terminal
MSINYDYLYAIIFMAIFGVIGWLNLFAAENVTDYEFNKPPLRDALHQLIPPISFTAPNILVTSIIIYFFLKFMWVNPNIVSYYCILATILFAIRIITFTVTQAPPPQDKNNPWRKDNCKKHVLRHIGFNFGKTDNTCVDYMFSGHAINSLMPAVFFWLFNPNVIENSIITILATINLVLISAARLHYTSDVIIGAVLSILTPLALPISMIWHT